MYELTDVPRAGTALALKCYQRTCTSKTGYHRNTVAQRRLAAHLTFKELAKLAGITRGALTTIEKYGAVPSDTTQLQLAVALNCTVAELWPEI
jgi:DNA-binding XRE family transcriptional regulator